MSGSGLPPSAAVEPNPLPPARPHSPMIPPRRAPELRQEQGVGEFFNTRAYASTVHVKAACIHEWLRRQVAISN